ncbi:Glu/Leu/Phe/Val dehydrogenase dimerization domain-containing protein [Agaribacterium haliotis]|uniref:Glu/Leu/Phe/Val dehydrogenase dimerization domain-containing protein n=1 Tax=Agaribacterium haliotis TaxID=2013869 RepID=UPI000BB54A54|nr:Glu/Leu/Phe/Val dehydrogenase dimerization domain-containing protein [Agaribacterium haliotis]
MILSPIQRYDDYEQVLFCQDRKTGLKAIIALHDTSLGNAIGGCRMWPYASTQDALIDALRLAKGMSYKCAMADLEVGGGKSVIIGDPRTDKTPQLLQAMAEKINQTAGQYVAAEDSGTTVRDMKIMQLHSPYIGGTTAVSGTLWQSNFGDPSPATAYGVFIGIKACAKARFGSEDLNGLRVNIQGLGSVGYRVAEQLAEAGAKLFVYDINSELVQRAVTMLGAKALDAEKIISNKADIFCPCAHGAVINDDTVDLLDVKIVAGAANNQLARPEQGRRLFERGILYAPDFVINAGGIIEVALGKQGYPGQAISDKVVNIKNSLAQIFECSELQHKAPFYIAEMLAIEKITKARARKMDTQTAPVHSNTSTDKNKLTSADTAAAKAAASRSDIANASNAIQQVAERFKVPHPC